MKKIDIIGELYLVEDRRPLARDNREDRRLLASEVIAFFERQGFGFAMPSARAYHVDCLLESVAFVRLICGNMVSEYELAENAQISISWLPASVGLA